MYQYYSCGYIEFIFEDFVEIGVDVIDMLQVGSNKNFGELKKKFGDRIIFCGGFDNQKVFEKLGVIFEEIKIEYCRVIDVFVLGGSYVVFLIIIGFDFVGLFFEEYFQYGMGFYVNQQQ